jgi:hypothetical protein
MGVWVMRKFLVTLTALAWVGLVAPAQASAPPLRSTNGSSCAQKRTDACGCHHHFGLRHCHPKRKTARCEAPVASQRPVPQQSTPVSL